jgi:RNA-directed DNA polymerase
MVSAFRSREDLVLENLALRRQLLALHAQQPRRRLTTIRKRLQAKLNAVKAELRRRMHEPIPEQGKWLQAVVRGHLRYYGVPMNTPALALFRFQVGRLWHRSLSRRSQNGRVLWDRMRRLIARWLPLPTVCHPYPLRRMGVIT